MHPKHIKSFKIISHYWLTLNWKKFQIAGVKSSVQSPLGFYLLCFNYFYEILPEGKLTKDKMSYGRQMFTVKSSLGTH